jgi:hypothetical protein
MKSGQISLCPGASRYNFTPNRRSSNGPAAGGVSTSDSNSKIKKIEKRLIPYAEKNIYPQGWGYISTIRKNMMS